jgi:sphinganine-1-phosphate aldolase
LNSERKERKKNSSKPPVTDTVCRIRNIVFFLFVLRWSRKAIRQLKGRGIVGTFSEAWIAARRVSYNLLLTLPGIRDKVQAQIADARVNLKKKLVPSGPDIERHLTLPAEGWDTDKVRAELIKLADMKHTRWEDGRVSGAVYHGGKELTALQTEAFGMFTVANPIHPDVFPGVRKMEAEVVAMVCKSTQTRYEDANGVGLVAFQCTSRVRWCNNCRWNRVHLDGMLGSQK